MSGTYGLDDSDPRIDLLSFLENHYPEYDFLDLCCLPEDVLKAIVVETVTAQAQEVLEGPMLASTAKKAEKDLAGAPEPTFAKQKTAQESVLEGPTLAESAVQVAEKNLSAPTYAEKKKTVRLTTTRCSRCRTVQRPGAAGVSTSMQPQSNAMATLETLSEMLNDSLALQIRGSIQKNGAWTIRARQRRPGDSFFHVQRQSGMC